MNSLTSPSRPLNFNPRARVGRDFHRVDRCNAPREFQSTRPRGARRVLFGTCDERFGFQSTRPRGARLRRRCGLLAHVGISIHAPAWGATGLIFLFFRHILISIHAPAWGATVPVYTGLITAVTLYFSRTSFLAVLLQAFFVAKSSV